MQYINDHGAALYKQSSDVSYQLGLVSWHELLERYKALKCMCAPGSAASVSLDRLLNVGQDEGESEEDDWTDQETAQRPQEASSGEGTWRELTDRVDEEDDIVLHYIPGSRTGLITWEFHPYDPDFFPSVPHGHHRQQRKTKLDAYLGWVYQRSKQVSREPRWKVIELWNDSQFRVVASNAVDYYLASHPHYAGWRVVSPRKLPRRR